MEHGRLQAYLQGAMQLAAGECIRSRDLQMGDW